jgi:hypothetical protein
MIRDRLETVFEGFPQSLVPPNAFQGLTRFGAELDALGRVDATTGEPLVDEHTLRSGLREFMDEIIADRLVRLLAELPAAAFRPAQQAGSPVTEISWFGLANEVLVFDPTPAARFAALNLPMELSGYNAVKAVRRYFPSLEEELLVPEGLPPRVALLIRDENRFRALLARVVRQLGWWSALVAVLLVPPVMLTESERVHGRDPGLWRNIWPFSMYLLATAIGGWTLTVVGSCILAPPE